MFSYLKGEVTLVNIESKLIFIEPLNSGIGFEVYLPKDEIEKIKKGEVITVYTHTVKRENELSLYGSIDENKINFFKLLLQVSNVGPKLAQKIIEKPIQDLVAAIKSGDKDFFFSISGVGKKSAERIIFELKDKIEKLDFAREIGTDKVVEIEEVVTLLENMGFSSKEARTAVEEVVSGGEESLENIIKKSLSKLAKR